MLLAFGCERAPEPVPAPSAPTVVLFEVAPSVVRAGGLVTVRWETAGATQVTLRETRQGMLREAMNRSAGALQTRVDADTVFTLELQSEHGLKNARTARVKVETAAPVEPVFTATPETVDAGAVSQLAWVAEGAQSVTLAPVGEAPLPLEGQQGSGIVDVRPTRSTTYVLTVDGRTIERTVFVRPQVFSFEASASAVKPGETFEVQWRTAGASRIELRRPDGAVLHTVADGPAVSEGQFALNVPPEASSSSYLSYVLVAFGGDRGQSQVSRTLSLSVAGRPVVTSFTVPRYVPLEGNVHVQWTTEGAEEIQLLLDDEVLYTSPNVTAARRGEHTFPSPPRQAVLKLVALDGRGGRDERTGTLEGIGRLGEASFSASQPGPIEVGGAPLTLRWEVKNARGLRILDLDNRVVLERSGPSAESGEVTVHPNRNHTTYALWATNQAGDTLESDAAPRVLVEVASVLSPTVPPRPVPTGATVEVAHPAAAGSGSPGIVRGVPSLVRNAAGAAFVDISETGTPVQFSNPDTGVTRVSLGREFRMTYYGGRHRTEHLAISVNGWMAPNGETSAGPTNNVKLPSSGLPPSAMAPLWGNLVLQSDSKVTWLDEGESPNRRLIVQWTNLHLKDIPESRLTFQAQLDELGTLVFAYAHLDGIEQAMPTIGAQNRAESVALTVAEAPVAGDTWTLFGPIPGPAPVPALGPPYVYFVELGAGALVEVEAAPRELPPGLLRITEVNASPAEGVTDGEWIELYNSWDQPIVLDGWSLGIEGAAPHTLSGPLTIPPQSYLLLAQSPNAGDGLSAHASYERALTLPDAEGTLLLGYQGRTYLRFKYAAAPGSGSKGVAIQQDPGDRRDLVYAKSNPRGFCAATTPYGAHGQRGTPGGPNSSCLPYVTRPIDLGVEPAARFRSLQGSGQRLLAGSATPKDTDDVLLTLTLPFDVRIGFEHVRSIKVSSNGFLAAEASDSAPYNAVAPHVGRPNGGVAPFWDNLRLNDSPDAGIYWEPEDPDGAPGTGDEAILVSWEDASFATPANLNFQVRLSVSGDIEFRYGEMSCPNDEPRARGSDATIWIEEAAGDSALLIGARDAIVQPQTSRRFVLTP